MDHALAHTGNPNHLEEIVKLVKVFVAAAFIVACVVAGAMASNAFYGFLGY